MSFKINPKRILDRQLCYRLWAKEGKSIYEIPKILRNEMGITNPNGKTISPQGVWRAASLYMLQNLEEVKSDTVSKLSQEGRVFDREAEEELYRELVAKEKQHLSKKLYREWIIKHPGLKTYEKVPG